MVNAKLHIICGNCGCADMLEYEITRDAYYVNEGEENECKEDGCVITCRNCSTLHFVSSVLPKAKEQDNATN